MIVASLHQVEDAGRRIAAVDLSLHQEIASSPQGAEEGGKQWLSSSPQHIPGCPPWREKCPCDNLGRGRRTYNGREIESTLADSIYLRKCESP